MTTYHVTVATGTGVGSLPYGITTATDPNISIDVDVVTISSVVNATNRVCNITYSGANPQAVINISMIIDNVTAINLITCTISFNDCSFDRSGTVDYNRLFHVSGGTLSLNNCDVTEFTGNYVELSIILWNIFGGAFLVDTNATLNIGGGNFSNNNIFINTTQAGNTQGGCIHATNSTISIIGATFTNNMANSENSNLRGGVLYCSNTSFFVDGCSFVNNSAQTITSNAALGGVIYATNTPQATISNTLFNGNFTRGSASTSTGGTLSLVFVGNLIMEGNVFQNSTSPRTNIVDLNLVTIFSINNCSFDNSSAPSFGLEDIYISRSVGSIANCSFHDASAPILAHVDHNLPNAVDIFNTLFYNNGVSIRASNQITLNLDQCAFYDNINNAIAFIIGSEIINITNSSIYNNSSVNPQVSINSGTMTNSTIYNNAGPAISVTELTTITNNTINSNLSGITNVGTSASTVNNSIIYGNTNFDSRGDFTANNNIIGTSIAGIITGVNNLNQDPLFGSFAYHGGFTQLLSLTPLSPAIDAGDVTYISLVDFPYDQRNRPLFPRVTNDQIDIGAYEFQDAVICFRWDAQVLIKDIDSSETGYINAKDVKHNQHLVFDNVNNVFIPIVYNIVTGKAKRFMRITKDLFGHNTPSQDLDLTAGHYVLVNGQEIKACDVPGAIMTKCEPEFVYSICTAKKEAININGLNIMTWSEKGWARRSKDISWSDNN